jgi:hypothetical protein
LNPEPGTLNPAYEGSCTSSSGRVCSGFSTVGDWEGRRTAARFFRAGAARLAIFLPLVAFFAVRAAFLRRVAPIFLDEPFRVLDRALVFAFFLRFLAMRPPD